jgi:hypothetical protein
MALAERLRADDVAEIEAAGLTPRQSLWRCWRRSTFAKTVFVNGEIAAMWGVDAHGLGNIGRPWFLTGPAIERIPMTVVRRGREEVALMLSVCPMLRNMVDGRYVRAVRFIEVLGFDISAPFPFGPHDVPFRRFELRR